MNFLTTNVQNTNNFQVNNNNICQRSSIETKAQIYENQFRKNCHLSNEKPTVFNSNPPTNPTKYNVQTVREHCFGNLF